MKQYAEQFYSGAVAPAATPNVPALRPSQQLAQQIVRESEGDEQMIEGVVTILRGIADMDNRLRSAEERLADFAREGVTVDRQQFLDRVMA
jgi:hypothetical protein